MHRNSRDQDSESKGDLRLLGPELTRGEREQGKAAVKAKLASNKGNVFGVSQTSQSAGRS